jgi:hypothetical protein
MPNGVAGGGSNGSGVKSEQRLKGVREEPKANVDAKANLSLNDLQGKTGADGGPKNFTKTETHTIEQVQADGEEVLKVTKSVTETVSNRHGNGEFTGDVKKKTVKDGSQEVTVVNEGQKTTLIKETTTTSNASKLRSPSKLPTLESPKRTVATVPVKTNVAERASTAEKASTPKKASPRAASAGSMPKASHRPASATPKESPRSKLEGREIKRPMTPQKGTSPRTASAGCYTYYKQLI